MRLLADSCKQHRKFWGTIGPGRENYELVRSLGAQLICPGGDVRVMINGIRELAKTFADYTPNGHAGSPNNGAAVAASPAAVTGGR